MVTMITCFSSSLFRIYGFYAILIIKRIIFLKIINKLIFVMVMSYVIFAVQVEFLNII